MSCTKKDKRNIFVELIEVYSGVIPAYVRHFSKVCDLSNPLTLLSLTALFRIVRPEK